MRVVKQWDYVSRLVRFALRANPLLYLSVVVSLISVAVELLAMSSLFPLFQVVSAGQPATSGLIARGLALLGLPTTATAFLWTFIALLALRIITQIAGTTLSTRLGKRVLAQLGSRAFEQIVHSLSIREIGKNSIGFYIGLAGDESFRASTLIISLTQFVSTAALALLYFIAIAIGSPVTATLVFVFLCGSALALVGVLRISHRLGIRQTEESRRAHSIFLDSLNNLKAVRAFSAESYVVGIYRQIIFGYTNILFWIEEVAMLARLGPVLLLLLIFGVWMAFSGQSLGNAGLASIVTMIIYLMRFFPTVGEGARLLFKIVSDARSGKDVTAILETPPPPHAATNAVIDRIELMELRDVSFSYDNTGGQEILSAVSMRFETGRSYAVTGRSGIGKSTLVDLLLKFYLPTRGTLLVNDRSIAAIADPHIRRKIILVSQESAIFDDTVLHNICLGIDAPLEAVHSACKTACIHEMIAGLPDGYETRLQYQGKNLSGGQRQRIAIARGLLRDPDVLILDESTSALDKPTQERVITNVLRAYADRIVIFVTHDPEIMSRVDTVIDLGQLVRASSSLTMTH